MATKLDAAAGSILREIHWSGQMVARPHDVTLIPYTEERPAGVISYHSEGDCDLDWTLHGSPVAHSHGTLAECTRNMSRGCPVEIQP